MVCFQVVAVVVGLLLCYFGDVDLGWIWFACLMACVVAGFGAVGLVSLCCFWLRTSVCGCGLPGLGGLVVLGGLLGL